MKKQNNKPEKASSPKSLGRPAGLVAGRITILVLGALSFFNSFNAPAFAEDLSGDDINKLKATEEKLFIRTYDDDQAEARVARIEKRMFGEAESGGLHDRLSKIVEIARPFEHKEAPKKAVTKAAPVRKEVSQEELRARQEDERELARQRAMAAKDDEVNQIFAEAVSLFKQQQRPAAMEKFQQVVRLDPSNAEAHFSLGVIFESEHKFKDALGSYMRAAEINPQKKEYRDAVAVVQKKAKNDDSDDPNRALANEAAQAYSRGEYMSALSLYKELDDKKPKQAKVKFNIGTIYLALKNPVQALEYFQEAYKLKPDEPKFKEAVDKLQGNLRQMEAERGGGGNYGNDNGGGGRQKGRDKRASKDNNGQGSPDWNHLGKTNINFSENNGTGGGGNGNGKMPSPAAAMGLMLKHHKDGIEVITVGIGSRAGACGLLKGDIIKAMDGVVVDSVDQVNAILSGKGNNQVQLLIQRGTKIGQVVF